jgi:hypothetical protein
MTCDLTNLITFSMNWNERSDEGSGLSDIIYGIFVFHARIL